MKLRYLLLLSLSALMAHAQTNPLRINAYVLLPKDSIESRLLTHALTNFLMLTSKSNEENDLVLKEAKVETYILLDEMRDIEKSAKEKDDYFYKPYLNNLMPLDDKSYLIQVSYIGYKDSSALLRAMFELIAHKTSTGYMFSSTLMENTRNWKTRRIGNMNFHYKHTLNKKKATSISKLSASFDTKLKSTNKQTDYYCCANMAELEKLIGVLYKSDYNGRKSGIWSAVSENRKLVVLGNNNEHFDTYDEHDLWHERLSVVIARNKVNKPVDEGCAYLYGGSWGFTWDEIFKAFKEQIALNKNTDWKEIKENPVYFKTKEFKNSADYIVNALLVQKIEKERGFAGVWEFLTIGPFEKCNEKYYQVLEKLTGITKESYNESIWQLINNQR